MPRKNHFLQFDAVLAELEKRRESLKDELRAPETHDGALQLKRQLDDAIACLQWCELHQISPLCKVTVLPEIRCQTPSSNYRILEDNETEDRQWWIELKEKGITHYFYPGDIVIEKP